MPVFTTKTSTDPGPFDALHPAGERAAERTNLVGGFDTLPEGLLGAPEELGVDGERDADGEREANGECDADGERDSRQTTHSAAGVTDEDSELEHLYRFQEIPVTAEMRRELLGAKLPLASAEQLADTQPPHKSSLSAPASLAFVDRHAPTEPALVSPNAARANERSKHERPLLERDRPLLERDRLPLERDRLPLERDRPPLERERRLLASDSYSTTAPTLLSVRRRRLRNQRYVMGALAVMILAILSGVAWRRTTRPPASLARDSAADRTKTPHIAGNRPGTLSPAERPAPPQRPGAPQRPAPSQPAKATEKANSDSQSAQLSSRATDATSSSPLPADSRSASRDARPTLPRVSPLPVPAASPIESHTASAATHAASKRLTGNTQKTAPGSKVEPTKSKAFDPEELIF